MSSLEKSFYPNFLIYAKIVKRDRYYYRENKQKSCVFANKTVKVVMS